MFNSKNFYPMKKSYLLLTVMLMVITLMSCAQSRKVSILGDSYSTFGGYIYPETNLAWYNGSDRGRAKNDVENVGETWWHQLLAIKGDSLEVNNSYSGATICCTGYGGRDFSDRSFITRAINLGNPDVILVFGGTNDSWAGAPIGEYSYSDFTKEQLYSFRPAFAYLLQLLQTLYPKARIVNITNSELSPEVTESMQTICNHYGVENVQLHDIDKQSGHPSVAGMKAIATQLADKY